LTSVKVGNPACALLEHTHKHTRIYKNRMNKSLKHVNKTCELESQQDFYYEAETSVWT